MIKRVAIPVSEGKLSESFSQCNYYEIFEISENNITEKEIKEPYKKDITKLPEWMASKGVSDIIAFKIDKSIIALFSPFRINLFVGIPVNTPCNLIEDYNSGTLKSNEKIISEILK